MGLYGGLGVRGVRGYKEYWGTSVTCVMGSRLVFVVFWVIDCIGVYWDICGLWVYGKCMGVYGCVWGYLGCIWYSGYV